MIADTPGLLDEIRARFAHVDTCPFAGPRIFFENAGGALRLKSVVETAALHAGYPDNQGRDNPASAALMDQIAHAKSDIRLFLNAPSGQVFVGESGTEVLFRLVRTAALGAAPGGEILSSSFEHPASRSAAARWAQVTGRPHVIVPHDDDRGVVTAAAYAAHVTPATRVATVLHTSPVTGMRADVPAIVAAIRAVSPDCFVIVDGIQHASHGDIDVAGYAIDGYAVSPYKVFARHGYGVGWASDRLSACPKEAVAGPDAPGWELGTRDSGSYATFSDVVAYFRWLGGCFTDSAEPRAQVEAAARAIHAHEHALIAAMLEGTGNLRGLAEMPGVRIVGGTATDGREGVVSYTLEGVDSEALCAFLRERGIRVHVRKADAYSGSILRPLGLESAVRASVCHYNSLGEVARFLAAMEAALTEAPRG